ASSGPVVKEAGEWDAPPPVRRGNASEAPPDEAAVLPDPLAPLAPPPRSATRLAKWIIIPFALLTVLGLGAGGVYVYWISFAKEYSLRRKAAETYDNGTFRTAASDYAQLAKKFPDSEHLKYYEFRAELSKLRHAAKEAGDPDELRKVFEQY